MKPGPQEIAQFRGWLVDRIRSTKWQAYGGSDALARDWGAKLGVAPELLREAYELERAALNSSEFRKLTGQRTSQTRQDTPQVYLEFPEGAWDAWHDQCDRLHFRSSELLRALVNAYLLSDWEPEAVHMGSRWIWEGKVCKVRKLAERKHSRRERALVSRGAHDALAYRARHNRVSFQGLLRGIVLEFLLGRVTPIPIEAKRMFQDPARYLRD